MPKVKKIRKTRTAAQSPAKRAIEKLYQSIGTLEDKLGKRYQKSIRAAEKNISTLKAKLEKTKKARLTSRPARGRKPAKNAAQLLQASLQAALAEHEFLTLDSKKFQASQKAAIAFEKEWKKSGAAKKKAGKPRTAIKRTRKARTSQNAADDYYQEDTRPAMVTESELETAE